MKKSVYLLSPKIKWKTFKELQKKLVRDSGPIPMEAERIYWELLRDNKIHCWFADDMLNDMGIGFKIPKRYKNWEIKVINSPARIIN